ncbi:hypothetical protein [Janibacter terrae]|uniref:hypothetical protein n=1 Tax=Janibacter terrae TaxID=103817 RepID=UPI000AE12359|nr:hypothetical protein [Janibacter terrae]
MDALVLDRFRGRILGAGSSSGLRLVIGDWSTSPLGSFTDVMVATADDRRVLLAPDRAVAEYVAATYTFDEVRLCPVVLRVDGDTWQLDAGPLACRLGLGTRTRVGRLLRPLPERVGRSRVFAHLADPVARRLLPGVRTVGSAGGGRREYYGAHDQHHVTSLTGTWEGADLGGLAPVRPAPRFGFSSTPVTPSLTRVTTTVARQVAAS